MSVLPIVERELRVAARRPATHWLRFCIAALVVVAWAALVTGARSYVSPRELGQHLFNAIAIPGLGYCLLAGAFLTADCLSSEKREGTLGLLFLTDLSSSDVVLGKLAATSLHGVYGVLAILPVLGLPLLLGGVTGAEYGRVALVLLATMFLSLALGLRVSAYVLEAPQALAATLGLLTVLAGVLPALYWLQKIFFEGALLGSVILLPSPGFGYVAALDASYQTSEGPWQFWLSLSAIVFLGLLFLMQACLVLRRKWREPRRSSATGDTLRPSPVQLSNGLQRWSNPWGPQRLPANPIHWLTNRDRRAPDMVFRITGCGAVLWLLFFIGIFMPHGREASFIVSLCVAFGLHQIFKCLFTVEACRRFSEDRATGALELLVVTPLDPQRVVAGHWRALKRNCTGARLILIIINLAFFCLALLPNPVHMGGEDRKIFATIFGGGGLMLFLDSYALGWQGMLLGLSGRKTNRAALVALGRLMLPLWAPLFVWIMMGVSGMLLNVEVVFIQVLLWFATGIALDAALGRRARFKLMTQFRHLVAETKLKKRIAFAAPLVAEETQL